MAKEPSRRGSWPTSWASPTRSATAAFACLLLAAEAVGGTAAEARDPVRRIDLPAGRLADSLNALSAATGVSIGASGALPAASVPAVHGRMTVDRALEILLRRTGLIAVPVGAAAFRLAPRPRPAPPRREPVRPSAPAAPRTEPDIVVTAQKRSQAFGDVAMSLSVLSPRNLPIGVLSDDRDLALASEGISLTNLGPGRNRLFIRGVADSPFIGPSQSTVAVQLDEARATFDAPDPDLRPVDLDRIEILKGPQGPLYGSGALGGIMHLVTRRPAMGESSAQVRTSVETVAHGGPGGGGEFVANVPLAGDVLAARAVGYAYRGGGWIDDVGGRRNANVQTTVGGRLAVRWRPGPDWTLDVGGTFQDLNVADSQYVVVSDDTLHRTPRAQEPADNDFGEAAATLAGRIGGAELVYAASWVDHHIDQTFDADATGSGRTFVDDRAYSLLNQELRLSRGGPGGWLAGLSYLRATTRARGSFRGSGTAADAIAEDLHRAVSEYAAFGEKGVRLSRRIAATLGLRLFRTVAEDETVEGPRGARDAASKTVLSPSAAISFTPVPGTIIYARYARAVRPGGLAPAGTDGPRRFDADELGTLDVGVRSGDPAGRLSLTGSIFLTDWSDVQSDYLLPNGLVSTRNAGKARIVGAEAGLDWRPAARTRISVGLSAQDARLVRNDVGAEIDDRRLPVAPDLTGRVAAGRSFSIGGWRSEATVQANYVGRARLAFDQDIDRAVGRYAVASAGATFSKGRIDLAAGIDNLFDAKGDTFAFGNPFTIRSTRQYVPLRPRTLTLSVGRRF